MSIAENIRISIWTFLMFVYYFSVPFTDLEGLLSPILFMFIIFNINKVVTGFKETKYTLIYIVWLIYLLISLSYSVYNGTDLYKGLRFLLILLVVPLGFMFKYERFSCYYNIFRILSICKSITLIIIAVWMIYLGDMAPFRLWFEQNHWGDAYFVYDIVPRVQVYGNTLLPIAFMISVYREGKVVNFFNVLLLLGVFIAGNAAFILGIMIFLLWKFKKSLLRFSYAKKVLAILIILPIIIFFLNYFYSEMERKSNTGNHVKFVQMEILLDTNTAVGEGIAARVPQMSSIGYPADTLYYEMQTFYIFYQLGLIGSLIFIILNIMSLKKYNFDTAFLYIIYLLYSAFNPGSFDTTHFIAILACCNLRKNISI